MLIVVASRADASARRLVEHLGSDAALITPLDLSEPGWQVDPFRPGTSTFVAGGKRYRETSISGVVTLLPCVFEQELVHIVSEDRRYVAAETTAFLACWLDGLECHRLNPPTAGCLSGPNWRAEGWIRLAGSAGIRAQTVTVSTDQTARGGPDAGTFAGVTVVGDRCIGAHSDELQTLARRLATAAGLDLLHVRFSLSFGEPFVCSVTPFADLSTPEAVEAVRAYFKERAA
jgi:hypothetical protein